MARPNVVKLVGVDTKNGEIIAVHISHELSGYKGKFVPEITKERAIDYLTEIGWLPEHDRILTESTHGEREKYGNKIVKFANEIKEYCKSRNSCYGCAFFDEEVAYEDGCRLNDRPMWWKEGENK